MASNTVILIWLFPVAFILHDLEELLFFEPWLKKNAGVVRERVGQKLPAFLDRQLENVLKKTTAQFAIPIVLIFILTVVSSYIAAKLGNYSFFLMAGSLFFMHGFIHIGQVILMRRYIPVLITSIIIVIPYGIIVFWNLLAARLTTLPWLLGYFIIALIIAIPFILIMHIIGESLEKTIRKLATR